MNSLSSTSGRLLLSLCQLAGCPMVSWVKFTDCSGNKLKAAGSVPGVKGNQHAV